MEIDDSKLIELVKKYNVIYDKNHGLHKNKRARFEAFKQIALVLDAPADICETRWCLLRNRFCSELRYLRNPADPSSQSRRPWPLFASMKFLTKFIYPRKTRSMLFGNTPNYYTCQQIKNENDIDIKEQPPEELEMTPSLSVSDNTDDLGDSNYEEVMNLPVTTSFDEDDEDILFGKMISRYLKRIKDVNNKIQIKIEIMSLFKTANVENS